MSEPKQTLKEWLNTPCSPEDLIPYKDDAGNVKAGVYYMPVTVVRKKIKFMEDEFEANIDNGIFVHSLYTFEKKLIATGSAEVSINSTSDAKDMFWQTLVGAATFYTSRYGDNTNYAPTLLSLCIVNALGSKYPQFGSEVNSIELEVVPSVDVNADLMEDAVKEVNECKTLPELTELHNVKYKQFQANEKFINAVVSKSQVLNLENKKK